MSDPSKTSGASSRMSIPPAIKYGIAAIFAVIGVAASIRLIVFPPSASLPIVSLAALSFICLLLVFFSEYVDWFDLKNFKVKLRSIEQKEKNIKKLAEAVADLVETANDGALVTHGFDESKFREALKRVRES